MFRTQGRAWLTRATPAALIAALVIAGPVAPSATAGWRQGSKKAPTTTTTTTIPRTTTTTAAPVTTSTSTPAAVASLPKLVSPAPSTVGYTQLFIPSGGGTFQLEASKDYRITAPSRIGRPVSLVGGRNIVWVGGAIRIDDQGSAAVGDHTRRGLTVSDGAGSLVQGRVVHLEGLRIDGTDLDEGIDVATPSAVVRIANTEIYGVHFRGSDDRDGTGAYVGGGNHPNALQTWGGFKELWIDGLAFTHSYEGLRLQNDKTSYQGPVHLRRVSMQAIGTASPEGITYYGHTNLAWARDVGRAGKLYVDNGTVFSQSHPNSGWVAATPNPRVWPAGFEAFNGGHYFGRAGRTTSSFAARATDASFDGGTDGWQQNNATSLGWDASRPHDGAGSLRVTGLFSTGFTAMNPVGPSIPAGSRDKRSAGSTVAAWVRVDTGATGTGWKATVQVRDSSYGVHQSGYVPLTPGVWTHVSFDAGALLGDVEKWGVSVARDGGPAGAVGFNIDTVQRGAAAATTTYIDDPVPGRSMAADAFRVFPASVSEGSDAIGPYQQLQHADLTSEDGVTPARIYAIPPTDASRIPNGQAGIGYISPG